MKTGKYRLTFGIAITENDPIDIKTERYVVVRGSKSGKTLSRLKKLWSHLIMQKYPVCCRCKCEKSVDPAHIYGKGIAPELALHPLNGIGLCRRCHEICDHGPDRDEIYRVARSVMGQEKFDELSEARYKPAPSLEESEKLLLFHLK